MFKSNGTDQPFSFHSWENFLKLLPSGLYFSYCSVSMSDSSWPHAQQHDRLPCPLPSPGACSNSCLLNQWRHPGFPGHPTTSSSVANFSSCPQSFLVSGSFPMCWLFTSGGQSIGASASVLPVNIQDWFPLRLTGWISLLFRGLKSLQHHSLKASILHCSTFFMIHLSHLNMNTGKTITLSLCWQSDASFFFLLCCLGWSRL